MSTQDKFMIVTSKTNTCSWTKSDGLECGSTQLVPGSNYCYHHYWQVLWTRTKLSNAPLPATTNWVGLSSLLLLMILFVAGYSLQPGWVFPVWINQLIDLFANPGLVQQEPQDVLWLTSWFAVGAGFFVKFWIWSLIFCFFPLKPKVRYASIAGWLIVDSFLLITLVASSVATMVLAHTFSLGWVNNIIVFIAFFVINLVIFYSANHVNIKVVNSLALTSVVVYSLAITSTSLYEVVVLREWQSAGLLIYRLFFAFTGIYAGYTLLSTNGRKSLERLLVKVITNLSDALRPLDIQVLDSPPSLNTRSLALSRALKAYSNLTPLEQEELDDYIIIKRRPSVTQTIIGLITIILSAFLLEAPAQQLFIWVACKLLRLGAPFCFQ